MVLSPNIFKFQMAAGSPYTFGGHLSRLGAAVLMLVIGWYTTIIFNGLQRIQFEAGNSGRHTNSIF